MIRIKHACAIQDQNFIISYERVDGRYKALPVDLTPPPPPSIKAGIQALLRREVVEKVTNINPAELDVASCPMCATKAWAFCQQCNSQVCMGKSKPGYFHCRSSCGANGPTRPATTCDAVDGGNRNKAISRAAQTKRISHV